MAYTASRSQHDFWPDPYNSSSYNSSPDPYNSSPSYQEQRYTMTDGTLSGAKSPRSPGPLHRPSAVGSSDYYKSSSDYYKPSSDYYTTPYNPSLSERAAPGYMRHTAASSFKATLSESTPKAISLSTPTKSSTPKSPPFASSPIVPAYDTGYGSVSRQLFGASSLGSISSPRQVSGLGMASPTVSNALIRAQAEEDVGKYTIVFDLDETLVYAREGPVRVRPGAQELMRSLAGKAEVILWTAGEKNYAQNAVRSFDTLSAVRQILARDHRWTKGFSGGTKDLRRLGRDTSRTLIIENTAECVKANTDAAILVPDYNAKGSDSALRDLMPILTGLLQSGRTVQDYLASNQGLAQTFCRIPSGETFTAFNVRGHTPTDAAR